MRVRRHAPRRALRRLVGVILALVYRGSGAMESLSPAGRPTGLRPIAGGAKPGFGDARSRYAVDPGAREASSAVGGADPATVVRLSGEALALAAAGQAAPSIPGPAEPSDAGARISEPSERGRAIEHFRRAQEPAPSARLIDAHA